MTVYQFSLDYAVKIGASAGYAEQLRVLTKRLPWNVDELTVKNIDGYLTSALHSLAPQTVQNHRRMLCTLRRAALRAGLLVDDCTSEIRRVKCPRPLPRAWTHEEIRRLIAAAQQMPGGTSRCPWKILLPAWILVAYSSGLRLGDMLTLRHDAIRGNKLAIVMQKTGRPHVVMLDSAALQAIASLPITGPKVFGSLVGRCVLIRAFRRLVKRSGMLGSGRFLRRSSATYAAVAGMNPSDHLGHLTPGLAARCYVDPVLVAELKSPVPSVALAID